MLNAITWQTFVLILLAMLAAYYILSAVIFFYKDALIWIKSRSNGAPLFRKPADVPDANIISESDAASMMGAIQELPTPEAEVAYETVAADEVEFIADDDEIPETFLPLIQKASPTDNLLIGSVADLLQEIKTLFKMLQEYNSSKEEGCNLLQSLLTKYPHLLESTFKDSITEYVCDLSRSGLPFELQYQEVNILWEQQAVPIAA